MASIVAIITEMRSLFASIDSKLILGILEIHYQVQSRLMLDRSLSSELVATQIPPTQQPTKIWQRYESQLVPILGVSNLVFLALAGVFFVSGKQQYKKLSAKIAYEQNKVSNLQGRLDSALSNVREWEENPDLVHSRDCNLDYIRMRMKDEQFNHALVNQVKVKIKQFISTAMRISLSKNTTIGIANRNGFGIDETFDITYETEVQGKRTRRVLFRIQIELMKLPAQSTSSTIKQIIECIEAFLSPDRKDTNWQPTIQGHIVTMNWNQKAKPTPLLSLKQDKGSVSVSFRNRMSKN